jgi:hypothetical protein
LVRLPDIFLFQTPKKDLKIKAIVKDSSIIDMWNTRDILLQALIQHGLHLYTKWMNRHEDLPSHGTLKLTRDSLLTGMRLKTERLQSELAFVRELRERGEEHLLLNHKIITLLDAKSQSLRKNSSRNIKNISNLPKMR